MVAVPTRNEVQLLSLTDAPTVINEVQTLRFTGNPTGGDVTLDFGGTAVGPIAFAGAGMGATTAANIEAALIASGAAATGDVVVTQVAGSDFDFTIEFTGMLAGTDVATWDSHPEQPRSRLAGNPADDSGDIRWQFLAFMARQDNGSDRARGNASPDRCQHPGGTRGSTDNRRWEHHGRPGGGGSLTDFEITFIGTLGNTEVPLIRVEQVNLNQGSVTIVEQTYGATLGLDFEVGATWGLMEALTNSGFRWATTKAA